MGTRPRRALTRVLPSLALVVALTGGVLLWLGLTTPDPLAGATFSSVGTGDEIRVDPEGVSLWSQDSSAPDALTCRLDEHGMVRPDTPYAVTVGATTYHEVARSPVGVEAGTYAVTCSPEQTVYAGPHAATTSGGIRGWGVVAGSALLGVALVLAVVALVRHRRAG